LISKLASFRGGNDKADEDASNLMKSNHIGTKEYYQRRQKIAKRKAETETQMTTTQLISFGNERLFQNKIKNLVYWKVFL
jgi:hypothetical protein